MHTEVTRIIAKMMNSSKVVIFGEKKKNVSHSKKTHLTCLLGNSISTSPLSVWWHLALWHLMVSRPGHYTQPKGVQMSIAYQRENITKQRAWHYNVSLWFNTVWADQRFNHWFAADCFSSLKNLLTGRWLDLLIYLIQYYIPPALFDIAELTGVAVLVLGRVMGVEIYLIAFIFSPGHKPNEWCITQHLFLLNNN